MPRRAVFFTALTVFVCAGLATNCGNPLKPQIDAEGRKVAEAKDRFNKIRKEVDADLQKEPDLFRAANVTAAWRDRFQTAEEKLNDASTDLERLNHRGKPELFGDVARLRDSAVAEAVSIQTEANRWLDLKRNTPQHLAHMQQDYSAVKSGNYAQATSAVERAEKDWPAKKTDLDARLALLQSAPAEAENAWADAQTAKTKNDYPALMADERKLDTLAAAPADVQKLVGQLYYSYDKLLVNLEGPRGADMTCREKIKTVKTQVLDVATNKNTSTTDEKWVDIPESTYASLKDNVGMDIEHKPVGKYDSEADRMPQPPGFAYMAPPGQRNQYGYWEQRDGGSFWTWVPEYLLMRELLWNHSYVPIPSYEYQGYWAARRSGTVYYGRDPGAGPQVQAAPKYGSHGTFTTGRFADSRYKSQGGSYRDSQYKPAAGSFRDSGYASGPSQATQGDRGHQFGKSSAPPSSGSQFGRAPSGAGRRFGSSSGSRSAPSGRRFGRR